MWPFPAAVPPAPKSTDHLRNRDILAGDDAARRRTRWTRLLIVYLRGLALLALVRGLIDWSSILGLVGPPDAFETASLTWQASVVLYAVLNCVAAVGLWLTSAWGAVLWLMVTLFEVLLPWTTLQTVREAGMGDILLLSLAVLYILLTWLSAREREKLH